ncbi:MAG: DNA-directed RNA polymerase subunit P [Candidatus Nanoarchaeia archaeon]|nr:DNA-directed RNA polymerase subunit P [Candidatus Nanoarchaeia archaeon]
MKSYKCLHCENMIKDEYIRKKIRCPYCGAKILYKTRTATTEVKAV